MEKKRTEIKRRFGGDDERFIPEIKGDEVNEFLNDLAIHIGWIIIKFNSLESQINFQIKEMLSKSVGQDEIVYLYLSKMPMNEKVELLIKLYGIWVFRDYELKKFREPLSALEGKLKLVLTNRNRYAHTDWTEMYENRFFKTKTKAMKDGVYHTFTKVEAEHMEEDLEIIEALHDELWTFNEDFHNAMLYPSEGNLVFSYGSNMYNQRLKNRVPSSETIGTGKLIGYKLEISKSSKDGSGKATVIKTNKPTDIVWGTLSIINKDEKPLLDKIEGLNQGYNEAHDVIKTESGEDLIAKFYIADEKYMNKILKPYTWYKTLMVEGAKLNELPFEYIQKLELIESIEDKNIERAKKELSVLIAKEK